MRFHGRWLATAWAVAALLKASVGATQPAEVTEAATATLLERLAADDSPLTSFRALRTLTAEAGRGRMSARLTAWTSLDPVGGFQYTVVDEEGSSMIRERVLRAALEAERKMVKTGAIDEGALTSANYEFARGIRLGDGLVRIGITPKRTETLLIDGSMILTEAEGDLVRVEGFLIKRPSFWTREVRVIRQYGRVGGFRVPTEMRSEARVLLVGQSTFSMVYEYTSVNGSPVGTVATSEPLGPGR